jgi:hypothetical protein
MKSIVFGLAAMLLACISCSKTSKLQKGEENPVSEPVERSKAYQDSIFRVERDSIRQLGSPEVYENYVNSQQDVFLRYEEKFVHMMLDGTIPKDFPAYSSELSEEKYMSIVKNWINSNPEKVKPEYR